MGWIMGVNERGVIGLPLIVVLVVILHSTKFVKNILRLSGVLLTWHVFLSLNKHVAGSEYRKTFKNQTNSCPFLKLQGYTVFI
jgi:hypothetical protein